jgi:hypothetical protein
MGLQTGSTTQQGTTTPGAAGQVNSALATAGGLGGFAAPSSLYQLTPAEQTFQGMGMGLDLPGSQAARALNYVQPGSPAGDMFQKYFQDFTAPTMSNNLLKSGYVGQSGANTQALANAGQTAAMQGLTGFGMPMAAADNVNNANGLGLAGLQRQNSLQDFGRIQSLLTSLLPYLGGSSTANGQTQGPGVGASLLNLLGGIGGSLFNGGLMGSGASLGGSLLAKLFGGSPASKTRANSSLFNTLPGGMIGDTAPSSVGDFGMPITDSGAGAGLPSAQDQINSLLANSEFGQ